MRNTLPFISIIIPAYNAEATMKLCLDSIMHLDYPKNRLEILVVDNGSTDKTPDIIKGYPVIYLEESKKGPGAARNRGIQTAKGGIIAFLDSDCIVDNNWLSDGIEGLHNYDICGGTIQSYNPISWIEIYSDNRRLLQNLKRCLECHYIPTGNMFVRKEVFTKIGLFDTTFPWAEDVDFSWRAFLANFRLGITNGATVYLKYRITLLDLYMQYFKYGYGIFFLKLRFDKLPDELEAKLKDAKSNLIELSVKKIIMGFYSGIIDIGKQRSIKRIYRLIDAIRAGATISGLYYAIYRENKKKLFVNINHKHKRLFGISNDRKTNI